METKKVEPLYTAVEQAPIMVHVTAPSTLPGGYKFDAHINDDPNKVFSCEVPDGGVKEGQVFLVPLSKDFGGPRIDAPTGHWKDGLCDCCTLGCCHPSLLCAWCCNVIAMGQVMTRMQLTWLGGIGPYSLTKYTFTIVVAIFVTLQIYALYVNHVQIKMTQEFVAAVQAGEDPVPPHLPFHYLVIIYVFLIWFIVATCRTRKAIRQRYQIPEKCCPGYGCEDCCCVYWCTCCTVSQMLRHTGEYEHYPGVCCSKTGHPPGTPLVV